MEERQDLQSREFDLGPGDVFLVGYWIDLGSGMVRDAGWERIEWLVANRLERVASAREGCDALYRDPRDGRLWEKIHPAAHLPGGGPPQLRVVPPEKAKARYGWTAES